MTAKGSISQPTHFRFQWLMALQLLWLAVVLAIGYWWTHLLIKQASRISDLELALGLKLETGAGFDLIKTHRMIFWESLSFMVLLVGISFLIFWMYWQELKRTRSVQAFFAALTHELRTPLTSIRLQAEALQDELAIVPQAETKLKFISRLLEDTLRLESQVEKTLDLARVEGGGQASVVSISLKTLLEREMQNWSDTLLEKIEIIKNLEEGDVLADPGALRSIVRNVLENAIRHGGTTDGKIRIQVGLGFSESFAVLSFFNSTPTGLSGLPKKVGTLFSKGSRSTGAGVGLYLIKTLMDRMGGKTEFYFSELQETSGESANGGSGFGVRLLFRVSK